MEVALTRSPGASGSNFFGLRLQIDYVDPRQLQAAETRTRKHSKVKIKKLARSIADHGMLLPIRVNAASRGVDGAESLCCARGAGSGQSNICARSCRQFA